MTWHAYVDESMRQRPDSTGIYVLAATILAPDTAGHIRDLARGIARGTRRFHWRDEEPADRTKAVDTVARLDAAHMVVVGTSLQNSRQERGRRKCLEHLLWHLDHAGAAQVWLEARTQSLNAKDIQLVNALRVQGTISIDMRAEFAYPSSEPLIWLPDVTAGAVSASYGEGDHHYTARLRPHLTEHVIEID